LIWFPIKAIAGNSAPFSFHVVACSLFLHIGPKPEMYMLRTIFERLSRGRSIKKRLPARFGGTCLYVSPDAQLKYLKPGKSAFNSDLLKVLDEQIREDSIVWDIGANVGVFALGAAYIARKGSTLAVEADIWLAQLIEKSISLPENRGLNIHVLPCAVSDKNGVASFLIANRGLASNSLEIARGRSQSGGIRKKVQVPSLTLDTLLDYFSPPTFLKIDVEGAEALVLKGARKMLAEIRPKIYIEVGRFAAREVTGMLLENRYMLFDGERPIKGQRAADFCPFNTIAVPH
jgi:FkbM family methyltransferase